jgi:5-methylcytosine-specific restriction protein A
MPTMPPTFNPTGRTRVQRERVTDRERGSARARGYDAQWERARRQHLADSPLCRYCELDGIVTAANTVDHFWGRGVRNVWFWSREWWVSTCPACHNGLKQAVEHAGRAALSDLARRLGLTRPG